MMRCSLPRVLALAAFPLAVGLALAVPAVAQAYNGHGRVVETYYASPTSILTVPTAYVETASYVLPTTSTTVLPTYYLSSSAYVVPTYRATRWVTPTRYVYRYRPLLSTSRVVGYDLYPTTYLLPTSSTTLLPTSSIDCCDPCAVAPMTVARSSNAARQAEVPELGEEEPVLDTKAIRSSPRTGTGGAGSKPSGAGGPGATTPNATGTQGTARPENLIDPGAPESPAPETESPPAGTEEPVDGTEIEGLDDTSREVFRPARYARTTLRGTVVSAQDTKGQGGVKVLAEPYSQSFRPKETTTDADGTFSLVLPEGDWTIRVARPDGEFVESHLTVSGGLITDDQERTVSRLQVSL